MRLYQDKVRKLSSRFIDRFEVILLDMGRTFMFDVDRFDKDSDLETSYRIAGGNELNGDEVYRVVSAVIDTMYEDSKDAANHENFASVWSYLNSHSASCWLSDQEKCILEKVIAQHEIGIIPASHIEILKALKKTHTLGVVSDIWSGSVNYFREFERVGINRLFKTVIFSSDIGIIKPSVKIFQEAAKAFDVEKSKMVYIGDSLRRDVAGAKNFGISAIWIRNDHVFGKGNTVEPDLTISDLKDVLFV